MVEMLSRLLREEYCATLRQEVRQLQKLGRLSSGKHPPFVTFLGVQHFFESTVEFLNLVFGHNEDSEVYWETLRRMLAFRFPRSTDLLPSDFNLKSYISNSVAAWNGNTDTVAEDTHAPMSGTCLLFVKLVHLTCIEFTGTIVFVWSIF